MKPSVLRPRSRGTKPWTTKLPIIAALACAFVALPMIIMLFKTPPPGKEAGTFANPAAPGAAADDGQASNAPPPQLPLGNQRPSSISSRAVPKMTRSAPPPPPPLTQLPPPKREDLYSSHHCTGGLGAADGWTERSCRFRNVCFDGASQQWHYYSRLSSSSSSSASASASQTLLPVLFDTAEAIEAAAAATATAAAAGAESTGNGDARTPPPGEKQTTRLPGTSSLGFPASFVNLRCFDPNLKTPWSPAVADGPVPKAHLPHFHGARYASLVQPFWPENFGHVLLDELFPVYVSLVNHGVLRMDGGGGRSRRTRGGGAGGGAVQENEDENDDDEEQVQLVYNQWCSDLERGKTGEFGWDAAMTARCEHFYRILIPGVTKRDPVSLSGLVGGAGSDGRGDGAVAADGGDGGSGSGGGGGGGGGGVVCFRNLFVGDGMQSFSGENRRSGSVRGNAGKGPLFWSYRNHVIRHLGLDAAAGAIGLQPGQLQLQQQQQQPQPALNPRPSSDYEMGSNGNTNGDANSNTKMAGRRQHHIILARKMGRRRILNADVLERAIASMSAESADPAGQGGDGGGSGGGGGGGDISIRVSTVDFASMSIDRQVSVMQTCTVFVSPCGGVSINALFLPRGAAAVFVDYWDPARRRPAQMEGYLWNYLGHFRDLHYPMKESEVHLEPPSGGDPALLASYARMGKARQYRDYGNVMVDVPRMLRVVREGMNHVEAGWQEEDDS